MHTNDGCAAGVTTTLPGSARSITLCRELDAAVASAAPRVHRLSELLASGSPSAGALAARAEAAYLAVGRVAFFARLLASEPKPRS